MQNIDEKERKKIVDTLISTYYIYEEKLKQTSKRIEELETEN